MATTQVKALKVSILDPPFMMLLDTYQQQRTSGICKNKLYQIIKELLTRSSQEETLKCIEKHPDIYEQYFKNIKMANYSNTKHYNKNESSGFDVDLIAKLTKKQEDQLLEASKVVGKDLKRVCRKY